MKAVPLLAHVALLAFSASSALPATHYVAASVSSSGDGTSWETALNTIQEGIDKASDGDTVIVAEAVYLENIDFHGKNITLHSTEPGDPAVVARTIVDGGGADSVVRFSGSENQTCLLSGFTLQNGSYNWGGGIFGNAGRATIQSNVIRNNRATQGGGLAYCDGVVRNNVISDNTAVQEGGGIYHCHGAVENNTIVGNSAERGGGLYGYEGTIRNCIIWGNVAQVDEQVVDTLSPTYCCIQNWDRGGQGNMPWFPYFMDLAHENYQLQSWSPCIDAGDPASDFSSEPEPNGGRINMGAYGNTAEASSSFEDADGDSLPDDWETRYFGDLSADASDDSDQDGVPNLEEYRAGTPPAGFWHVDGSVEVSENGRSWARAFKTIQEGIDSAQDGDTVLVAQRTYYENIHFKGRNIVLTSTDPLDPVVVANTIIDGNHSASVVTFSGIEDETCVLSGFTIRNGIAQDGGGLCGGTWDGEQTLATIENNIITRNSADRSGGGLAYCDGTIYRNTITGNSAEMSGAGLHYCCGTIYNNIITGNSADQGGGVGYCHGTICENTISGNSAGIGGGLCYCNGTIYNNTITGNSAGSGGGLVDCDGTIQNNLISGNSAGYGGGLSCCDGTIRNNAITGNSAGDGGGGLEYCRGAVRNNIIAGNWAGWAGGGLCWCNGAIQNNTIIGNSARSWGGGVIGEGECTNCIIWGNAAARDSDVWEAGTPTHCCIQDWSNDGEGNITAPPQFVDPDGPDDDPETYEDNDYRLLPTSPCINQGNNEDWIWRAVDLDGNPRLWAGTVDMGAYEYGSWPFMIVAMWESVGGRQIMWNSRPADTYTVCSCLDLSAWTAEATLPSQGETTSWVDTTLAEGMKFYRIELE